MPCPSDLLPFFARCRSREPDSTMTACSEIKAIEPSMTVRYRRELRLTTLPDRRRSVFVGADRNGSLRSHRTARTELGRIAFAPHKHRIFLEVVLSEATRAGRLPGWMPPAFSDWAVGCGHDPGPNLNACCRSAPGSEQGPPHGLWLAKSTAPWAVGLASMLIANRRFGR